MVLSRSALLVISWLLLVPVGHASEKSGSAPCDQVSLALDPNASTGRPSEVTGRDVRMLLKRSVCEDPGIKALPIIWVELKQEDGARFCRESNWDSNKNVCKKHDLDWRPNAFALKPNDNVNIISTLVKPKSGLTKVDVSEVSDQGELLTRRTLSQ